MDTNDMENTKEEFIPPTYKNESSFRIEYFSLSKRVLIGCLVISWTLFAMITLRFMQRGEYFTYFHHSD
jgi:hypothetical protein